MEMRVYYYFYFVAFFSLAQLCEALAFKNYTVEVIREGETKPKWANFQTICELGVPTDVSKLRQGFAEIQLQFQFDFFGQPYDWYLAPYGFISPTKNAMCSGFCEDTTFDTLYGYYNFQKPQKEASNALVNGGGDWPMIGLYVDDLSTEESTTKLCVLSESDVAIVEFKNFITNSDEQAFLTAQIHLFEDGRIALVYDQVSAWNSKSSTAIPPSVGLVLSRNIRMIADTPNPDNGIVAYLFTPITDPCSIKDETSCTSTDDCSWCALTDQCMNSVAQVDLCPSTEIKTHETNEFQIFYKVEYEKNCTMEANLKGERFSLADGPIELKFNFDFPFFGAPVSSMFLIEPNILSVTREQSCRPLWNTCANGNYTFAFLPFQTAMTWGNGNIAGRQYEAATFCDDCPPCYVLQVKDVKPYVYRFMSSPYLLSYQIILFGNGTISVTYESNTVVVVGDIPSPLFAYPPAQVGVVRHTVSDPSSTMVPNLLIHSRDRFTFTPLSSSCGDCGLHGNCTASTCKCATGFSGTHCESCASGFYGNLCSPCHADCRGTCEDGKLGSGACVTETCGLCNLNNGKCSNGVCVCNSGWSGASCAQEEDTCRKISLSGCPYCAFASGCSYCFDYTCFDPDVSGTPGGYSCSYSISDYNDLACTYVYQSVYAPFDVGIIAVVSCVLLILLLIVCSIFAYNYFHHRRQVEDIHVTAAIGGSRTMVPPRRERCVIPINIIQRRNVGDDQYVMGFPLQQLPLKTLYERRYEEEKR